MYCTALHIYLASTLLSLLRHSYAALLRTFHQRPPALYSDRLRVICRHALRLPSPFDLQPAVARIIDQHKSIALHHIVLGLALCRVLVERFYVVEFLGTASRRNSWALLLARMAAGHRRA